MAPIVLLSLLATALVSFALGWFFSRNGATKEHSRLLADRDHAVQERRRLEHELAALRGRIEEEQRLRTASETKLIAATELAEEQQRFLVSSKEQMEQSFAALSRKVLSDATESFLMIARSKFDGTKSEIDSSIETKKKDLEQLLAPLREMLDTYRKELHQSESVRTEVYGSLKQQIEGLLSAQQTTQQETSKLIAALRVPNVRGSWGENTLRNCVEMAGMSQYCDFSLQETIVAGDEGRRIRPDLIIRLPNQRVIAVDSKAPIDAYLESQSESDENRRRTLLEQHAKNLRKHIELLGRKEYGANIEGSLDFTLLFLGGEQFLSAALLIDPGIFHFAAERNIFLATPTILLPLLRAVEKGWKAERSEEHAKEALAIGQDLYERFVKMFEHFEGIGDSLASTVKKYNETVRSIETRILPKAKQLQQHVDSRKEVVELGQIQQQPIEVPTVGLHQARIPLRAHGELEILETAHESGTRLP